MCPIRGMKITTFVDLVMVMGKEALVFLRSFSFFALKSLYSQVPVPPACLIPKRKRGGGEERATLG